MIVHTTEEDHLGITITTTMIGDIIHAEEEVRAKVFIAFSWVFNSFIKL